MNAIYRLALTGFVAAMIAGGSAFASDWEWATFPTVQTSVTYCRPVEKETTVAINSHGKSVGRVAGKTASGKRRFHRSETPRGSVVSFAPTE